MVEPAKYVAALSLVAYSAVLVGAVAFAPDLAASVVITGVAGLLAVAFGGAVVAYALGTNLDATYRAVEGITLAKATNEARKLGEDLGTINIERTRVDHVGSPSYFPNVEYAPFCLSNYTCQVMSREYSQYGGQESQ